MLSIIAAVAQNNVIGKDGTIPWNIPEEMALFKKITMGSPVILGRKTFESIGRTLPGREMFVLTHSSLPLFKGDLPAGQAGLEGVQFAQPTPPNLPLKRGGSVTFCSSIQNALDKTKNERTVFVMGGSDVYAQMMPFVDEMLISHLREAFTGDCYFPEIDKNIWHIAQQQEFPDFIHIKYTRT